MKFGEWLLPAARVTRGTGLFDGPRIFRLSKSSAESSAGRRLLA